MVSKVEICGVNTAKLPLYKEAEMMQMIEKIQAGDQAVRDEFIKGNLRLVLSVIQRFSNRGENPDDLFQVGLHRSDQGARQLSILSAWREVFDLCGADDHRRGPPLSQRQQRVSACRGRLRDTCCTRRCQTKRAAREASCSGSRAWRKSRQGYGDATARGSSCWRWNRDSGAGLAV